MSEMEYPKPLRLGIKNWRSRWIWVGKSRCLHRVAKAKWRNVQDYGGSLVEGEGTSVCGMSGGIFMPGIFSRMGAKRCVNCCKALKLPQGKGSPYNDPGLTAKQQNT